MIADLKSVCFNNRLQSRVLVSFLAGIFAFFCALSGVQAKSASAPEFSLKDLSGKDFTLSVALKAKKKLVLFFWASWCPHCQDALKLLAKKKGNYSLITINIGEPKDTIYRFMQRRSYNFTVLLDEESEVSTNYGVVGIPTFIVIEPDASISYRDYCFPPDLE